MFIFYAFFNTASANSIKGAFGYELGEIIDSIENKYYVTQISSPKSIQIGNKSFKPDKPLPFLNKYETIVGIIIVPYFLFFIKDFIYSKKLLFTASLILLIKIMISFSPQTGVNVKQYFYGNNFIKTYDTFWNKENSAVQKFPWIEQKNFPLDWTHLSKTNRKKGFHRNFYDF